MPALPVFDNPMPPATLSPELLSDMLNRVENIIEDTCIECGYDQQNIKATNWVYILYQIGRKIFAPHPELVRDTRTGTFSTDNINTFYDYIYSPLCDKYGTIKGIVPFCRMLAIEYQSIVREWEKNGNVTSNGLSIYRKINTDRKESIQDNMINSNTNPVKYLSILNHEYGFNETHIERIDDSKPVLSLDDIPELPDTTAEKELPEKLALPNFEDDE